MSLKPLSIDINTTDEQYNKKVKLFFQMKTNWENTKKRGAGIKCPICGNITKKMNFEISHDLYLADCGKKICPKLEIPRRTYSLYRDKIQQMMIKKSNLQRKFIIEKMDTMFKFIDNKNAIKEFNKDIEEYRELCKILDEHTANINKQKHYDHIDELNSRLFIELQKIKELEQNIRNNTTITNVATSALIDDIINITIDKIQPLNDEIQNVKYPIMELNIRKNGELYLYQCDELPQFIPL